jgi:hypothetical protein
MVGTTRFELAASPTPILEITQSEQLSYTHQCVKEQEKQPDATLIGPVMDPRWRTRLARHERQPAGPNSAAEAFDVAVGRSLLIIPRTDPYERSLAHTALISDGPTASRMLLQQALL